MNFLEMTNKDQEDHYKSTLNLVNIFVKSNQRKRINLLSDIESYVENIFSVSYTHLTLPTNREV